MLLNEKQVAPSRSTTSYTVSDPKSSTVSKSGASKQKQQYQKNVRKQFSGGLGFVSFTRTFRHPKRERIIDPNEMDEEHGGKKAYMNQFGKEKYMYEDIDVQLSPEDYFPQRLLVQTTNAIHQFNTAQPPNWRTTTISGSVPLPLRISEIGLWPLDIYRDPVTGERRAFWQLLAPVSFLLTMIIVMIVAIPLQLLLAYGGDDTDPWSNDDVHDSFLSWPGYHWRWPKYATNPLDMQPEEDNPKRLAAGSGQQESNALQNAIRKRLIRPRQLMVLGTSGEWRLQKDSPEKYVFVSWHWRSFGYKYSKVCRMDPPEKVSEMAKHAATSAGLQAYWLDIECNAHEADSDGSIADDDMYRMSDVIRSASHCCVLLPDRDQQHRFDWGERLWTLPEGLLAPGLLSVLTYEDKGDHKTEKFGKVEMTHHFWKDRDKDTSPMRLLAEHFSGVITLSRLELFTIAIAAFSRQRSDSLGEADMAYAFMGLLHYRLKPLKGDTNFQVIARLSLANDSDRLVERMVSLYQKPSAQEQSLGKSPTHLENVFVNLAQADQFETHVWDIEPRCEVVGLSGEGDNAVFLNDCRAIPIRWDRFPMVKYKRNYGNKKMIAALFVRAGSWWVMTGATLAFTYAPFFAAASGSNSDEVSKVKNAFDQKVLHENLLWTLGVFLVIGFILSLSSPFAIRRLFGGVVLETAPELVGFAGVMPIRKLERKIFGNHQARLSYDPSSTPFCMYNRDAIRRRGQEPPWVVNDRWINDTSAQPRPELLPRHRVFTIVDIGNLTVSIIQARRPPTVALLCGSEGGMLRAVLCSWRFSNDCLYKESVMRMTSETWHQAKATGWLKLNLHSQGDAVPEMDF